MSNETEPKRPRSRGWAGLLSLIMISAGALSLGIVVLGLFFASILEMLGGDFGNVGYVGFILVILVFSGLYGILVWLDRRDGRL